MIQEDKLKHLKWGIIIGFLGSIICAIVAGLSAEYKDKAWHGKWDNQDLAFTILGGFFGECLRILIFYLFKDDMILLINKFLNFL